MKEVDINKSIISPATRLRKIIDEAYSIFCQQVVGGVIEIDNEASMQLFLSNNLMQIGRLYEFATDERFIIILEATQKDLNTTKSPKNGRADIWLKLIKGTVTLSEAAIELKCLINRGNMAVTDVRYSVYKDLENLERYQSINDNQDLIICEIVFTNYNELTRDKKLKLNLGDNTTIRSYTEDDKVYHPIILNHEYPVNWDIYGDKQCFVKIYPK